MKNHSTSQEDDQNPEKKRRDNHMEEVKGIGYLPRDLIIEILSRLPPKIICKIRCVSKSWNTLLTSDKVFLARQIEWSKQEPLLLIRRYIDGIREPNSSKITIELTSIDMQGEVTDIFREVMDRPLHNFVSCGPLSILCCMYTLYVCNPSIHQVVRVPYHSNSRLYYIGFGYIPLSNEYKIVHLFCHSFVGNGKMGCEIFSFKAGEGVASGSWRKIEDCPFSAWTEDYPVCVNGVIYWSLSSELKDKTILSLDLEKGEFSSISYPIFSSEKYTFLEYTGLMGALCVVGFSPEASIMDIWMLKDNKNKIWEIELSINLFPYCPRFLIPSDCNSDEILVHMEGDIFCYGLKNRTSRRVGYYRVMQTYNKPYLYYGSLLALCARDLIWSFRKIPLHLQSILLPEKYIWCEDSHELIRLKLCILTLTQPFVVCLFADEISSFGLPISNVSLEKKQGGELIPVCI
ncbi:hypothetical protein ACJIZ3_021801 [Penstemon smallii]|uniref:F-box domain-containing protein n=1 Tax=Penstemon smallii TaxID=265156 RepID=A0ABD3SNC1_9LAMI